jgi:hypothetical protein
MMKTLTLAIGALLLAACAYTAPPPPAPPGAYYSPDMSGGAGHPSSSYPGPRTY